MRAEELSFQPWLWKYLITLLKEQKNAIYKTAEEVKMFSIIYTHFPIPLLPQVSPLMAKSEELVRIRNLLNNTRIRNLLNNTHKHSSSIHVLTFQFSRTAVKDNWSFSLKLQPLKVHHYMTSREIRTYFGVDTHEKGIIFVIIYTVEWYHPLLASQQRLNWTMIF